MAFTANPIASIAVKRGPIGPMGPAGSPGADGKSYSLAEIDSYITPAVQAIIGNDFDLVSVYQLKT